MATVLLTAGATGKRYALANSTIHMHQALTSAQGQASDIEIHAREILKIRQQINEILADCTGQPMERVQRDTERDFFMGPEAAREYGLIDEIIASTKMSSEQDPTQA